MTDNEEAKWTPETDIMQSYLNLDPQYKIIYEDNHNKKVVKVKLKNNVKFVLKHLRIETTKNSQINHLFREYRIGKILGKLTDGIAMSKNIRKKEVEKYTVIEILMEYGGISLSTFMDKGKLEEGDTMKIACQLLSTLTLMEELGISHLDIKPLNIVWDKNKNRVKLIDFGTSLMSFGKNNRVFKEVNSNEILGYTRLYSAPEIKEKAKRVITQKLDVYSFGVTFLRLLAVEYKIQNPIEHDIDFFIKEVNIEKLKEKAEREDMDDLWEVIYKTIERIPECRPTFRELREVFLKQAKEMTEDDYLLDVIDNLNDHPIKIELTNNLKLKNTYQSLMYLYKKMENRDMQVKCLKKYLKICSRLEGEESLDVAYSYHRLARFYIAINEDEEVISCLKKALSILLNMNIKNNLLLKMVYNTMGNFYIYLDDYKKAKEQFDKARKIKSEEYVEVNLYNSILEVLAYGANYEELTKIYYKVLEKIQKKESVQDKPTPGLYIILGIICLHKDNYEKAKKAFNEALNIILSKYGEQNSFLINVYSLLGMLDFLIGNFDQAMKALDKGLSISFVIYGEMHSNTILLYQCKAVVYAFEGNYERSIKFLDKSLNISLHIFGLHNRFTVKLYLSLGMLYCDIFDFIKAKSNCLKALDIAVKLFKEENEAHLMMYSTLGRLSLLYESNADKAIHYYNRALNVVLKICDKNHLLLLSIYINLVSAYLFKGDFQEAIRLCDISLNILSRAGIKEGQIFGWFCFNLGNAYSITGNEGLGIKYINKALNTFSSVYGNQNILITTICSLIRFIYQIKGAYVQSSEMLNELSKIHESGIIKGNIYTLLYYFALGNGYCLKEDYLNAKAAWKQALEISLNIFGELHFITAMCLCILGTVYGGLKNIKKAEKCLNKALNILMKISAGTYSFTGEVYLNLARIYKMTDRYEEALCALDKGLNILNLDPTSNKNLLSNGNKMMEELCEIIERGN